MPQHKPPEKTTEHSRNEEARRQRDKEQEDLASKYYVWAEEVFNTWIENKSLTKEKIKEIYNQEVDPKKINLRSLTIWLCEQAKGYRGTSETHAEVFRILDRCKRCATPEAAREDIEKSQVSTTRPRKNT